jgi:hypothetical protein
MLELTNNKKVKMVFEQTAKQALRVMNP